MAGEPSMRLILHAVSVAFDVPVQRIASHVRDAETMVARHAAYALAKRLTTKSLNQIGRELGGRDHTTVITGTRKAAMLIATNEGFAEMVANTEVAIASIHDLGGDGTESEPSALSPRALVIAASIKERLTDPDVSTIAHDILVGGREAALRAPAPHVLALAALAAAAGDLAAHTAKLLTLIDEFALDLPSPLRRRELAREAKELIPEVTRCLREIGHSTEAIHGETDDEAEDRRAELAGATDAR